MSSKNLVQEDDRTIAAPRRRSLGERKRKVRRQAPTVFKRQADGESGTESGTESGDESEIESRLKIQTQTPTAATTRRTSTSQLSTTTSSVVTTTQEPSLQTTTFATSSTAPQSANNPPSTTSPPRRPVSSIIADVKSSANPSPTPLIITPGAETINEVTPAQQTRTHKTLSHGATIALEVLGILLAISLFLLAAFLFRRRIIKKARNTTPALTSSSSTPPTNPFSDPKPSEVTTSQVPGPGPIPFLTRFFTPGARSAPSTYSPSSPIATSEYIRNERIARVKPELLAPHNNNFMHNISRDPSSPTKEDQETTTTTRKAFLKRNTSGKIVMKPSGGQDKKFSFGYEPREREVVGDLERGEERVVIEASGEWDDARTVAGGSTKSAARNGNGIGLGVDVLKPLAGLMAAQKAAGNMGKSGELKKLETRDLIVENGNGIGKANDPTLMSGGLRNSTYTLPALKGLDNRDDGVPYQSRTVSETESGALGKANGKGFGELEGLRRGDDRDEFGRLARERQSMMSGTVRSTTSWNTSVWERLEKERVGKKGREVFEGGVGGGVGSRESTATSVAVWRGMGNWVEDQVERRGGGGENREKAGMKKLDG